MHEPIIQSTLVQRANEIHMEGLQKAEVFTLLGNIQPLGSMCSKSNQPIKNDKKKRTRLLSTI